MKLHQLRYLAAVAQNGLNITAAAEKLHTSQPGVSKQIKLLEDELGFQIFVRDGRTLTRITPAGQQVIDRATRILQEVQNIKRLSDEWQAEWDRISAEREGKIREIRERERERAARGPFWYFPYSPFDSLESDTQIYTQIYSHTHTQIYTQ